MTENLGKVLRNYLLPIVILVIIATITYNLLNNTDNTNINNNIYKVISSNLTEEEQKKILGEVIEQENSYKYIAQLKLAYLMTKENKEEAVSIYTQLINDKKCLKYIRDLAEQRLMIIEGHAVSDHNMYYFSNELLKAINLMQEKEDESAISILQNLQENFETPSSIQSLAKEILAVSVS